MNSNFVFKILEHKEWFNKEEEYKGSLIDLKDGFIHLSTNNQIYETCKKHFFGKENLIVIYFKIKDLENNLKWEKSRNDDLFPHYYGKIKKKLMIGFFKIRRISDGSHEFPEDFITGKLFNK
tara:strand:+ start:300 stop:665 length:366 start_codon:yes stop_codon:yes gene_type:complete